MTAAIPQILRRAIERGMGTTEILDRYPVDRRSVRAARRVLAAEDTERRRTAAQDTADAELRRWLQAAQAMLDDGATQAQVASALSCTVGRVHYRLGTGDLVSPSRAARAARAVALRDACADLEADEQDLADRFGRTVRRVRQIRRKLQEEGR